MIIRKVNISGYRQLQSIELNIEEGITVIAGANNSGKTSIVELFNNVFGNHKNRFMSDDFSIVTCKEWQDKIYPYVKDTFINYDDKEEIVQKIIELIFSLDEPEKAIIIDPIRVKIQVDYDPKSDDIRNFADYIMDLDESKNSFFFLYEYSVEPNNFKDILVNEFEKINDRFNKIIKMKNKDEVTVRVIKEMLLEIYANSTRENAFFTDDKYENQVLMEISTFKSLFNYQNIMASRNLDDGKNDMTRSLSKSMIELASDDEDWDILIRSLPDKILQPIQESKFQSKVRETSLDSLSSSLKEIASTNGGNTGDIMLDMNITEASIHSLLSSITSARYQLEEYYLNESSQGLGYSNMIYIHLQLEKYCRSLDPYIVNFFIIEEPEAHMHPQMQNVFTHYIYNYYSEKKEIQGLITTHSSGVVRNSMMKQIRVLKQIGIFESHLYDFHEFSDIISAETEISEFYDWFYAINFSDIVFADKIIMYEGDTERMLIKKIIQNSEYKPLRGQYISFVQVGGAYAYNYRKIIDFIKTKTLIITDIDYDIKTASKDDVLKSNITNSTILNFYKETFGNNSKPTVRELYKWKKNAGKKIQFDNGMIFLAFQGQNEKFSRTLEEAMLAKYYDMTVFEKKTKKEWKALRRNDNLKYVIPRDDKKINLRDIVLHTANNKTDFIYSVIIEGLAVEMLPEYIREGLIWLTK